MPAAGAANSMTSRPRISSAGPVTAIRPAGSVRPTSVVPVGSCRSPVEIVPIRTDDLGRVSRIGSLLHVSDDGSIERTLITGRVLFHESIREAIARNVAKDLGDIALPMLPQSLQPFTVAEFFPTPGLSEYYDPRQHAITLCYVVPIAGDCKPQDETLDVEWVDPRGEMMETFIRQMTNGHGRIVRQALAWLDL